MSDNKVVGSNNRGDHSGQASDVGVHEESTAVVCDDSERLPGGPGDEAGGDIPSNDDDESSQDSDISAGSSDRDPEGTDTGNDSGSAAQRDDQIDWSDGLKVETRIRQQATPYYVSFRVKRQALDPVCAKFLSNIRKMLNQQIQIIANDKDRGKRDLARFAMRDYIRRKRPVPASLLEQVFNRATLYAPVFRDIIIREVASKHEREILFIQDFSMQDQEDEYAISAYFFFVPDVSGDFSDVDLEVEVFRKTPQEIETILDRKFEAIAKAAVITDPKDGRAEEGDAIVCSITGVRDGKRFEPACIKSHVLYLSDEYEWMSPFKHYAPTLVGSNAGEHSVLRVVWNDGIPIELHVHVQAVMSARKATLDEMAEKNGYGTALKWKDRIRELMIQEESDHAKVAIRSAIERRIRESATVDQVPMSWLTNKVRDFKATSHVHDAEDEEILSKKLGISRQELDSYLGIRIMSDLERSLLIRAFGQQIGIPGDPSVENLDAYVDSVWKWIDQKAQVSIITTEILEERRKASGIDRVIDEG